MLPRERVMAALDFQAPDVPPVEYHSSAAGMYEHGPKLLELMTRCGHDFGDASAFNLAAPDPRWIDASGRYCEYRTDDHGVTWEHLIFGIAGHPVKRPLDDWNNWDAWLASLPPLPVSSGPDFEAFCSRNAAHMQRFFLKNGWNNIFELMQAVRCFEEVLMDIALDTPEINRLADTLCARAAAGVKHLLAAGADGIQFGDDFGTQQALLISKETFRRFFKPRYAELFAPVKAAGKKIFFHSCGMIGEILEDLAEIGANTIWPQVPLFNARELSARCRDLKLAVAIHPDRSHMMTNGTPAEIRANVRQLAADFRVMEGGSWFYIEIDNGFPWENTKTLIETVAEMREGKA